MCGVGLISSEKPNEIREQIARKMTKALHLRGPDSSGILSHKNITFLHTRLAIIDLSPTGHQPMSSKNGRWIISYNGEIYNFKVLKAQLEQEGQRFSGHSDTEVLVQMLEKYGIEKTLLSIRGMFAFIALDKNYNQIYLCRDRVGEKPLYYGTIGKDFVCGSDLKVFRSHPEWTRELDPEAINAYTKYNCIPDPMCIFKGIKKVMPGSYVKLDLGLHQETHKKYWDPPVSSIDVDWNLTEQESFNLIEEELDRIVYEQMVSDAPLGSFLSGGLDSSLITALMQKHATQPINTFTIGFTEDIYNESDSAKRIASHLGCNHTEWIISAKELQMMVPRMPEFYSEPFADSSQIPTSLLAQMTRQKVKVCLSGDGGDELFGGYNRYMYTQKVYSTFFWLPRFLRLMTGYGLKSIPEGLFDVFYSLIKSNRSQLLNVHNPYQKLNKLSELLGARSKNQLFDYITRQWIHPENILLNNTDKDLFPLNEPIENLVGYMINKDYQFYLPNDILTKVDRATMGSSLESRAPFLDYKLIELVHNMPLHLRIAGLDGKKPIKSILNKYVPNNLFDRPKMGFGVPIDQWLRGDLKEWAMDLLNPRRLNEQGIYNSKNVQKCLSDHLSGHRNNHHHLWNILMFQQWFEKWVI